MARTTIVSAATITTDFTDNQVRVRVSAGDLGFITDLADASSGTLEVQWEFSYLDDPDVTVDTEWYTPRDEAHVAANVITGIAEGQSVYDISNRFPGTTSGQFLPGGVPSGMNWMRVSVRLTASDLNTTTVIALHNPGPASFTL